MTNILSRRISLGLDHPVLSRGQLEMDQAQAGISGAISDWRSILPAMLGGFAYRAGKVGLLSLESRHVFPWATRAVATLFGFGCEVTTFRASHALLHSTPLQFVFDRQWLKTALDFAVLRGMGSAFAGQNVLLMNLAQSGGMVLGNELGAQFHWVEREEGNLIQRLARAQVLNMQMAAGMALGHFVTQGRWERLERSLDLRAQVIERSSPIYSPSSSLHEVSQFSMQGAGFEKVLEGEAGERASNLVTYLHELKINRYLSPLELYGLILVFEREGLAPVFSGERLEALRKIPDVRVRRSSFLRAILQREGAVQGRATGVAEFVDFLSLKQESDRVAVTRDFLKKDWQREVLREIQKGVCLADCNFGRKEAVLEVFDHHGIYAQERNSTEQMLARMELELYFSGRDLALESPRPEHVEEVVQVLNIREISTDNLGDGAWCVWIAQNQRRVLSDPALRRLIRAATHFEDFTAFGNNYDRNDPAVQLQAALFKRYGDNLSSKGIFGSDRFPPDKAREVIADAMKDITELVENEDVRTREAQEFWRQVDEARTVAARSVLLEREREGRRAFAMYDLSPLKTYSIFAQWLAIPDLQREVSSSEKLPLQATVNVMPSLRGPEGEVLRILPIIAIPDGRALPSGRGLLHLLPLFNEAERVQTELLRRRGRVPPEFKANFWFGKETVILPAPNNGGTVLSPEEIAEILMSDELGLFEAAVLASY